MERLLQLKEPVVEYSGETRTTKDVLPVTTGMSRTKSAASSILSQK